MRFGFSGVSPTVSDPLYFLCQYNFALHSKRDSKFQSSSLIFPICSHLILLIIGCTDVNLVILSKTYLFVQNLPFCPNLTNQGILWIPVHPEKAVQWVCQTCKAMSVQTVLDFWLLYAEEHVTAFAKGASLESYLNEIRCS